MPLTKFRCPNGEEIAIQDCLTECRLLRRCLTKNTLRIIAGTERAWDGVPHVTSLLNGVMQEYLKITVEYAEDPRSRAFTLLGSAYHKLLDTDALSEIPLSGIDSQGTAWIQGTADLVEQDDNGELILVDAKTWGSYRVSRALGLQKVNKEFRINPLAADLKNEELQLNMYRIMLKELDMDISRMALQVTVRDGGTMASRNYGIDKNIYMIPVQEMGDSQCMEYFSNKADQVKLALSGGGAEPCSDEETWNQRRCKDYCPVNIACPQFNG